jgi:nucleoside phosphorylase
MAKSKPFELQIFLHFINREASDSGELARSEARDVETIKTLLLAHSGKLSVNISQLLEYVHDRPTLNSLLEKLFRAGLLDTTSHDTDIERFIDNRQRLYGHIQARYPMYFGADRDLIRFQITRVNSFSMSQLLRTELLSIRQGELPTFARYALSQDRTTLLKGIDDIQKAIALNSQAAITSASLKAVTKNNSLEPPDWRSIGRIFSAMYFEKYSKGNLQRVCSGITTRGYLDDLEHFPNYDEPTLAEFLRIMLVPARGIDKLTAEELIEAYGTPVHLDFVDALQTVILGLNTVFLSLMNTQNLGPDSVRSYREGFLRFANEQIRKYGTSPLQGSIPLLSRLQIATTEIEWIATQLSKAYPLFSEVWKENTRMTATKTFVILTATSKEDERLNNALLLDGYRSEGLFDLGGVFCTRYRSRNDTVIFKVRTGAGAIGPSGATLVSGDAIRALKPDYVISLGICFGLDSDKQKIGDVLVAEHILDYETIRDGAQEMRERGQRVPAGRALLSAVWAVQSSAQRDYNVRIGLMISGQKLVDNPETVAALRARFPDALGGEMEGNGISSAALAGQVEWLMIKGICDWGQGKGDSDQEMAADNAMDFGLTVISTIASAKSV